MAVDIQYKNMDVAALGFCYHLAGRAFSDPNDPMFLVDSPMDDATDGPELRDLSDDWKKILDRWFDLQETAHRPAELEAIRAEYTRLFLTGLVCPHHESDYIGESVFRKSDLVADLSGFYSAFGLNLSPSAKMQADYIGTELEFAGMLALKELYARRTGKSNEAEICQTARKKFLQDHLGRWAIAFGQKLKEQSDSPFYQKLAEAVEKTVAQDCSSLQVEQAAVKPAAFSFPVEAPPRDCSVGDCACRCSQDSEGGIQV